MSLSRPSRSELVTSLKAAIESRLSASQLRRSDAKVYSRAFAGTADAIYSLVAYMHKQQFVFSCDSEYLDRHGSLYNVTRQAAEKASVTIQFDVSGGGTVPSGTVVQTTDGTRFVTTADSDDDGLAAAEAESAGTDGNMDAGTECSLISPISGVATDAEFSTASEGGTDAESDENYRSRILLKMRETPMGGAESDYKTWAREIAGVTRVWVTTGENGTGSVTVRFTCDDNDDIIPDEEMVSKVASYINTVRPVCALVSVEAPIAYPVDITFSALSPDSELVRAQVEAELKSLFLREGEPGTALPISHIRAAISGAAGETDYTLTAPTANIDPGTGYIPTLGTITWPA